MNTELLGIAAMFLLSIFLAIPLGRYIAKVYEGKHTWLDAVMSPVDKLFYTLGGIHPEREMTWKQHLTALLTLNLVWCVLSMLVLMNMGSLPLNPDANPSMSADLAFNSTISFISNTNLQHYSGESGVSYLGQLMLMLFQFISAGAGMAVCAMVFTAMKERTAEKLGNFYFFFVRSCTRVLLPLSVVVATILLFTGVPDTFKGKDQFISLQGDTVHVSRGPVAAMVAIKQLGTNGGGFFGANSAQPFENPGYFSNMVENICIVLIPMALIFTLGAMLKRKKLAWVIFGVMTLGLLLFVIPSIYNEMKGSGAMTPLGISQPLGSMEGKEIRFGAAASAYWGITTTVTSNGSVNAMHDSFTPLTGMFCMLGMMVNSFFGGVGVGFLNFYIYMIIAVFISGLMVGRTPEFLGKKIEGKEMKIATIIALLHTLLILAFTAVSAHLYALHPAQHAGWLNNPGPHGFSEMLYEYTSSSANNGSGFEGLGDGVPFWNITCGFVMLLARFLPIIGPVAIAGILARKKYVPETSGTLKTDTATFGIMVFAVIMIVAALSFFPALTLGTAFQNTSQRNNKRVMKRNENNKLFEPALVKEALKQSILKLNPSILIHNPVMFTVEIGTAVMLAVCIWIILGEKSQGGLAYNLTVFIVLLLTLLFANFAEAIAEARGKAQADSLRKTREDTPAKKIFPVGEIYTDEVRVVPSSELRRGDLFLCEAGDTIPMDGEIVEGLATIDESAITGESAPVIRESGGDKSSVTGGTKVLSDHIKVKVTTDPGESFLDKMIALVEGASRQKTPNEIALTILLAGFTLIFIIVCVTLKPFGEYAQTPITIAAFISLFVCLIPTTIGGLLSAIGIAGMDRALRANVITKSGKAVETAGDLDTLLLDKTGTITIGNRKATHFWAANGIDEKIFIGACAMSSLADETPEGKSIVELAAIQPNTVSRSGAIFIEFTAETRSSGIDLPDGTKIRKGAYDAIRNLVAKAGHAFPEETTERVKTIANNGGTPLVVSQNAFVLGVIELQDIIKPGIFERFDRLRKMGVKTVMVTGDNPLTAKYIAEKAGVDDFIAEAKPEDKMNYIKKEQQGGKLVAMMGDGTNDAPALAQADVGVAMNSGTQAAKEAGNMVDLDNDPTKLIEIVEIGKQLLMTRGTLTTFSIANDVAKYFAIVPALFIVSIPGLQALNIMRLHSPESAILSAVIFNAIIIPLLIPLALRGVAYKPIGASALLRRNLLIYGLGGVIVPFIGIKLLDLVLSHWF